MRWQQAEPQRCLMKKTVRTMICASSALAFLTFSHDVYAQSHSVLLRVSPTQGAISPAPLRDSCLNPGAWPTGWDRMDLFSNAQNFFDQMTSSERTQCFSNLV